MAFTFFRIVKRDIQNPNKVDGQERHVSDIIHKIFYVKFFISIMENLYKIFQKYIMLKYFANDIIDIN